MKVVHNKLNPRSEKCHLLMKKEDDKIKNEENRAEHYIGCE